MLILKPGREKSIRQGHPWVYSGAVAQIAGTPGDLVPIRSAQGEILAYALLSPASPICARIVSLGANLPPSNWLHERIAQAFGRRASILNEQTTACRRIHGEADELPGLICDQYGNAVVLQLNIAGWDRRRSEIVAALASLGVHNIYLRGDAEARRREGLVVESGALSGSADWHHLLMRENGLAFRVDAAGGHKTGFYLDQRDNRALVRALSAGKRVLNLCAYSGGFTVAAAAGGATAWTSVDVSSRAIELGRENLGLNGFAMGTWVQADVFDFLRGEHATWDMIVLDPPAFAKTKAQVDGAARGYKDVNRLALRLLRVGGDMLTFSCSQHISLELFQKIIFAAAHEAGASVQVLRRLGAGYDHPFHLRHPEGEYLKGFWLRRIG